MAAVKYPNMRVIFSRKTRQEIIRTPSYPRILSMEKWESHCIHKYTKVHTYLGALNVISFSRIVVRIWANFAWELPGTFIHVPSNLALNLFLWNHLDNLQRAASLFTFLLYTEISKSRSEVRILTSGKNDSLSVRSSNLKYLLDYHYMTF